MKLIPKIAAFLFLIIMITGCTGQQKSAEKLLEDETRRTEIMTSISSDKEMITEMQEHMLKSEHYKDVMIGTSHMMDSMMMNHPELRSHRMKRMMHVMAKDSTMCMEMASMISDDEHMRDVMMESCTMDEEKMCKSNVKGHIQMH